MQIIVKRNQIIGKIIKRIKHKICQWKLSSKIWDLRIKSF